MGKTIHFNTGRKYTANGQRITATLHDDGVVTFFDHDRSVDGEYNLAALTGASGEDLELFHNQGAVMGEYDGMRAPNTQRSWQDGMMRGGVNSQYRGR